MAGFSEGRCRRRYVINSGVDVQQLVEVGASAGPVALRGLRPPARRRTAQLGSGLGEEAARGGGRALAAAAALVDKDAAGELEAAVASRERER